MSKRFIFLNKEDRFSELVNNIISKSDSSLSDQYKKPSKVVYNACTPKNKFPQYPINNIYKPELFLDQNYIQIFLCGICEYVCDDPVVQTCGCEQIYCRKCLQLYYKDYQRKCPECGKTNSEPIQVTSSNVAIKLKKMKCKNYKLKCTWQGQCGDYKCHLTKNCPKEIINCPNNNCKVKSRRDEMDSHVIICEYRDYICENCNLIMPFKDLSDHKEICPKEKIYCPLNCGTLIERQDINLHKKKCINSIIDCPYSFLGCNHKLIKKDKNKLLNKYMSIHLELAVKKVKEMEELKQKIQQYKKEIKELKCYKEKYTLKKHYNKIKNKSEENISNKQNNNEILDIESKNKRHESYTIFNSDNDVIDKSHNNISSGLKKSCYIDLYDEESYSGQFKEEKNIYELFYKIKDLFIINNNIIESKFHMSKKQYYVFFNQKFDIPKISPKKYIIEFKLLKDTQWLGLGLCDKKVVKYNNYEFFPSKTRDGKRPNIGTYFISTNKMAWNCNNKNQSKIFIQAINKKDTIIECILSPKECELEFKCNNNSIVKFNNVRCFKSDYFSPCLIFLHHSKVETLFKYE